VTEILQTLLLGSTIIRIECFVSFKIAFTGLSWLEYPTFHPFHGFFNVILSKSSIGKTKCFSPKPVGKWLLKRTKSVFNKVEKYYNNKFLSSNNKYLLMILLNKRNELIF